MTYKKVSYLILSLICFHSPHIFAMDNVHAKIELELEITESGCIISPESTNILVNLGTQATKEFKTIGSRSLKTDFQIKLQECQSDSISIMFNGEHADFNENYLAIEGGYLSGVAIELTDHNNVPIALNKKGALINVKDGENILKYSANYISGKENISPGLANATMTFGLYYD